MLTGNGSSVRRKDRNGIQRIAPLVGVKQHDAGMSEVTVYLKRQIIELLLIRDKTGTGCYGHQHTIGICLMLKVQELSPQIHLSIMATHIAVLLLHVAFYVRQRIGMSMELQMAIQLFSDTADMLQPFIKAHLILCFLGNSHQYPAYSTRRNDAADNHHLAMRTAHHIIYDRAKRRLKHTRCAVCQTHNNLATVILLHGAQDTTCYIGAHTVQGSHRHICRCSYLLSTLKHPLTLLVVTHNLFTVLRIVRDTETHQGIRDVGVTDKDGQLRHYIHIIMLTIGNKTLTVIRTSVVLQCCIAQCQMLGTITGGEPANDTTEENKHYGGVQYLIRHQIYLRSSSYHNNSQRTGSMGIGKAEHQPHRVTVLPTPPRHSSSGKKLGERSYCHHHKDNPKRIGVAQHNANINEHSHTYQEVRDEDGVTHKLQT